MRIATMKSTCLMGLVLLLIPALVPAECTDLFENLAEDGNNYFGLRSDGANVACGESITFDCNSRILELHFRLILAGPGGDIPPLVQGDILQGALLDMDGNVLSSVETAIAHAGGADWVDFDFSGDTTTYPAGDYIVAVATEVAGVGYVPMDTQSGFPGGTRWGSHGGLAGPWTEVGTWDYTFSITVETELTPAADASWSAVKKQYD